MKATMTKPNARGWRLDRAILAHAEITPDKTALRSDNSDLTYAMLARRVTAMAAFLHLHVGRGARFAVYSMNHPDSFVMLLAAARSGAIMVPLNWRLTVAELRYQMVDCAPQFLVYGEEFADKVAALVADMPAIRTVMLADIDDAIGPMTPMHDDGADALDDDLLVVYTSGTTGRPKGAVLPQRAMRSNAVMCHHAFSMTADDVVLNILPLFHVGGINIQPVPALIKGATVVIKQAFDPGETLAQIAAQKITQITTVPTILGALLAQPEWAVCDLSSVRMIAIGSTDVPVPMIEAVHARGIPVVQIYGATETAPAAIYQTADIAFDSIGSIGHAGCDTAIRLVDALGKDVPNGTVGEIWVKGANILARYWNDADTTAANITDGWFHTGDMARRDPAGLYWFADRLKHVIISGGENIYPAELERVLAGHPDLAEFAIIGRDDDRWGQVPVVVAVRRTERIDAKQIDAAAVMAVFDGEVARFKQPKDVVFVAALPRNALGKIVLDEVAQLLA
jgi:fatty-acyl-CoA synthase